MLRKKLTHYLALSARCGLLGYLEFLKLNQKLRRKCGETGLRSRNVPFLALCAIFCDFLCHLETPWRFPRTCWCPKVLVSNGFKLEKDIRHMVLEGQFLGLGSQCRCNSFWCVCSSQYNTVWKPAHSTLSRVSNPWQRICICSLCLYHTVTHTLEYHTELNKIIIHKSTNPVRLFFVWTSCAGSHNALWPYTPSLPSRQQQHLQAGAGQAGWEKASCENGPLDNVPRTRFWAYRFRHPQCHPHKRYPLPAWLVLCGAGDGVCCEMWDASCHQNATGGCGLSSVGSSACAISPYFAVFIDLRLRRCLLILRDIVITTYDDLCLRLWSSEGENAAAVCEWPWGSWLLVLKWVFWCLGRKWIVKLAW